MTILCFFDKIIVAYVIENGFSKDFSVKLISIYCDIMVLNLGNLKHIKLTLCTYKIFEIMIFQNTAHFMDL